jgi:hypothetical protein
MLLWGATAGRAATVTDGSAIGPHRIAGFE